jgi:hypothetical protein
MAKKPAKPPVDKSKLKNIKTEIPFEITNPENITITKELVEDEVKVVSDQQAEIEIKHETKEEEEIVEKKVESKIDSEDKTKQEVLNNTRNDKTETGIHLEDNFSISENIFIEVHKSNLLQYFSAGCIFASQYASQKAFSDPQSIKENAILISNGLISNDRDHILIQIDPSVLNKALLVIQNSFGLYSGIIPVSRITKIFVQDIETKKKTLDDSLIRDAGIIPEALIEVGFPINLSKISYVDLTIAIQNLEPQLYQFDKILGLIAGTKNFNFLTLNG